MKRAVLVVALLASMAALAQVMLTYPGRLLSGGGSGAGQQEVDVFFGDSITYGYTFDAEPYPARTAALTGRTSLNFGKGGDTAAGAYERWQLYGKTLPRVRWLVILIGTNNLTAGNTGAATWATVQAWIEEALAAGQRVAVWSILPRGGWAGHTPSIETERQAFNAALAAYVAAHPNVKLLDGQVLAASGDPTLLDNIYNWADGLHVNGLAYALMAMRSAEAMQ